MFKMKRPYGFNFTFGFDDKWMPQIIFTRQYPGHVRPRGIHKTGYCAQKVETVQNGGFKIDFGIGTVRRPIRRWYKKEAWSQDYGIKNAETNPWNSGNHWFVLNIPVCPYIFICAILPTFKASNPIIRGVNKVLSWFGADKKYETYQPGFYIGGRTCKMHSMSHHLIKYKEDGSIDHFVKLDGNPVYAWGDVTDVGNIYVEPTATLRIDFGH